MCALCGMLMDGPHWTEAGTDAGRVDDAPDGRSLLLERDYRITLINRVLGHYGCSARDWAGSQYIVQNASGGASEVVINLPQLWQAIENITRKMADPLDAKLIGRLEERAHGRL
ncbi:MAG: hypothetical protein QGI52_08765 [Alphaproteobacteria bacterium]|nr:hypothetical protein [Alphaproteobacteria bacterium]MDP7642529.1 hypothetical protein [Alphaproteobacteria bacterium]